MTKKIGTLRTEKGRAIQGQRDMRKTNIKMKRELAAARALLREVFDDGNLDMGDQVAKELDERIRSYLDACDTLGDKNG